MAVLNEEQTMLRDMAREWTRNESPVSAFRKVRDSGSAHDASAWSQMAGMGWTGVIIPEAYGGSEFGSLSMGLVLEETGRTLVASPLNASAMAAASALVLGGTDAQKQTWLPSIASGETIATLAVDEGPRHDPDRISASAGKSGEGWILSGTKMFVAEGSAAHLFITAARTEDGVALFLVPGDAEGLTRSARSMTDARDHADITLEGVRLPGDAMIGEPGGELLDKVLDRARAGAAAEMLGMAAQAFEDTLDYLKQREQFGEILARFQALQHRMAHMFTEIELTRSAVEGVLTAIDQDRPDIAQLASVAKASANQTLHLVSREAIQLHGGVGMTDEYDVGFYIKRARILENAWGNTSFHKERYARLNGY